MLLSPSRADCVVFELEGVLISVGAPSESEPSDSPHVLPAPRWDKLPVPVGVITSLSREKAAEYLTAIGWNDLPPGRLVCAAPSSGANPLETLCRALGGSWPLVLGATPSSLDMTVRLGRGDFAGIGKGVVGCPIRFTSASDAIRAILGVF